MKDTNKLSAPMRWSGVDDFSSHRELLYVMLENTNGKVIEFGSGFGSTPLLADYCEQKEREFISYETNEKWANKTGSKFVESYFDIPLPIINPPTIIFVDCAPASIRKDLLEKYANISHILIVHDTEESANYVYGMREILATFKYRLNYNPRSNPSTTAVSNFLNIEAWV